MANLTTKKISEVQPGWLHTDNGSGTPINVDADGEQVHDGGGNATGLWLTNGKGIGINVAPETNATLTAKQQGDETNDYPILSCINHDGTAHLKITHENWYNVDAHKEFKIHAISDPADTGYNASTITLKSVGSSGAGGHGFINFETGQWNVGSSTDDIYYTTINPNGNVGIGNQSGSQTHKLEVEGNALISGLLYQSAYMLYVDADEGSDVNVGTTLGSALATVDEALSRISGTIGGHVKIYLVGKDNTSSGNIADSGYTIENQYQITNTLLEFIGVKFDGTALPSNDNQHDYPRLHFTMLTTNTTGQVRESNGIDALGNSIVNFSYLRIVSPIYVGGDDSATYQKGGVGLIRFTSASNGKAGFFYCRTELGDGCIVGARYGQIEIQNYRNRIIRSNTALTYGTIGQTGGQDNGGTASNPPIHGGTYFTNQADSGYFADISRCQWWWEGSGILDGANAGFYGFYPHTNSSGDGSYTYADPTSDNRFERGYNMVNGVGTGFYYYMNGDSGQRLPINVQSNLTTAYWDTVGGREDKEWYIG